MKILHVILDNGHGNNTPGKRSPKWPDGKQLLEWKYTRDVVNTIMEDFKYYSGITFHKLVPEDVDISLNERCKRANTIARCFGKDNCILISIHVNASTGLPNAKAKGWEVHTYTGQTSSDKYATIMWDEASKILQEDTPMRGDKTDGDPDWDSNFAILRDTLMPSMLTENLFMDNAQDCKFLLSAEGFRDIVNLHVNGIMEIHKTISKS